MKRVVSLFLVFSTPLSWADGGAGVLSLGECVERALTANPALTLAQDEVGITKARKRVASVAMIPALSAKLDEIRLKGGRG